MADQTHIEWTDATWNPITGCTLVSDGCKHCYAATLAATRLKHHPSRAGLARLNAAGEAKFTGEVRFNEQWLDQPLRWRKPRMIFVCAHGDLFHENVGNTWIDRVFAVMALTPQHTFQVLTKRPDRMRRYLQRIMRDGGWLNVASAAGKMCGDDAYADVIQSSCPLPNVWLGVSVENQEAADQRIPDLLQTPAAVRFVSAEPLLGPVDLKFYLHEVGIGVDLSKDAGGGSFKWDTPPLDWVIVGGESGRNARPMHPDWARSLRDQCVAADVSFFFKQWGEWFPYGEMDATGRWNTTQRGKTPGFWHEWAEPEISIRIGKRAAGRLLDGREWNEVPE